MSGRQGSQSRSRPIGTGLSPTKSHLSGSAIAGSPSRSISTQRRASPAAAGTPPVRQIPLPRQVSNGSDADDDENQAPLAGVPASQSSLPGPRQSSLSQAIQASYSSSPPRFGTSPSGRARHLREASEGGSFSRGSRPNYGSFDSRSLQPEYGKSPQKNEDIEAVRRHLVGPAHAGSGSNLSAQYEAAGSVRRNPNLGTSPAPGIDEDEFSSLQLQGGDVTRHIYRYTEEREREQAEEGMRREGRLKRSLSVNLPQPEGEDDDIRNIRKPGGMRRDYIRRNMESPAPSDRAAIGGNGSLQVPGEPAGRPKPQFLANNFIEFLTLYGHFAGEQLDEDDEVLGPDEYFSSDAYEGATDDDDREREYGEDSALLTPGTPGKRRRRRKEKHAGKGTAGGAALLLIKSFVGTGVVFLARAFLNGGMVFSSLVLLAISALSFWCFLLLVRTRLKVHASFGDMGGKIYGRHFRSLINFSLVISQIGFSSAYMVFVSENLQAFFLAVSDSRMFIEVKWFILAQMLVYLPISLYRNINNIQKLALVADLFIILGLLYLYFYDIKTIVQHHGVHDIVAFNSESWTLFIGTAIFTFEGIGLIIPIQSSMAKPEAFISVLSWVMVLITAVFVSMGALSYAAYGSATKTVIFSNLPQDDKLVNAVQCIYSLAILMSTPLQIYPAIEITSQQLFSKTGKYNPFVKWKKNMFRFLMVFICATIAWAAQSDLDKFVSLVGSFACIPLVYIYPPLMHYKVVSTKTWQRVADILLVILGLVGMVYTTVLTIRSFITGESGS